MDETRRIPVLVRIYLPNHQISQSFVKSHTHDASSMHPIVQTFSRNLHIRMAEDPRATACAACNRVVEQIQ